MKEILKKRWKFILLLVIIFIVLIPLFINFLYKTHVNIFIFQSEWGAGDALGFYGCVLGGLLTVYGVFLTIQFTQKNYQEDVRNRVLPFIAADILGVKSRKILFQTTAEEINERTNYYEEYQQDKVYYVIENGIPTKKSNLTDEQREKVITGGGKIITNSPNAYTLQPIDYINLPCVLCNAGNGAAINLRVGLNRKGNSKNEYLPPRPLNINQTFMLIIYAEGHNAENAGEYHLACYYEDILGNKYRQVFQVNISVGIENNIKKIETKVLITAGFDYIGVQEQITDEEYFG